MQGELTLEERQRHLRVRLDDVLNELDVGRVGRRGRRDGLDRRLLGRLLLLMLARSSDRRSGRFALLVGLLRSLLGRRLGCLAGPERRRTDRHILPLARAVDGADLLEEVLLLARSLRAKDAEDGRRRLAVHIRQVDEDVGEERDVREKDRDGAEARLLLGEVGS